LLGSPLENRTTKDALSSFTSITTLPGRGQETQRSSSACHYYDPLTVRMSDLALEAGQEPALTALLADIRSEMLVMKHFGES